jgi:hypothetical protein
LEYTEATCMKRLLTMTLALASMGYAIAQDVPPPPPLKGDAASLADTMKFLQSKLPGKVNYIVYFHDNITGTELPPMKRSFELSNVSADAGSCTIRFHSRFDNGKNANNIIDRDDEISLKPVREITLMTMEQVIVQADAKAGHPERSNKVEPALFLVVINLGEHRRMMLNFYDETVPDRVAKAMSHAVDLCGGGNQDPF